ncbi:NAD-dependent epimerase/dehydratase family protein (plasmid) [Streptomyces sp. BI20]|uniref:NAD-dependent epimerase/dehydratase family protein n=1 Tax=Streptomyces sp. BI20 TaxID=3403460 RepID=UPI003C77A9CE
MTTRPVLLLTGGLGVVGGVLRPALRERHHLRIVDRIRTDPAPAAEGPDEIRHGDLTDPEFADEVTRGVSAVVHLAAVADPRSPWRRVADNVTVTDHLLRAAERHGVGRIVMAGSVHAAGLDHRDHPRRRAPVDPTDPPRPCCPYGGSKVACESLGRLHSLRTGATVLTLRLGLTGWPLTERDYNDMWLSDDDARAVFTRALTAPVRHGIHFAVSRPGAARWDLSTTRRDLGWTPRSELPAGAADLPWAREAPCELFTPHPSTTTPTDLTPTDPRTHETRNR